MEAPATEWRCSDAQTQAPHKQIPVTWTWEGPRRPVLEGHLEACIVGQQRPAWERQRMPALDSEACETGDVG